MSSLSPRAASDDPEDTIQDIEDPYDLFSDSLFSLFDHVMPAKGEPLQLYTYEPPSYLNLPSLTCRIPPQQNTSHFAHFVWNASILLADRIVSSKIPGLEFNHNLNSNSSPRTEEEGSFIEEGDGGRRGERSRVCELGCGAGIPGLMAARSSNVESVIITDYDDPLLVENLTRNISMERDQEVKKKLKALGHTWGDVESLEKMIELNDSQRFTHILLADTLWLIPTHDSLISSLLDLLAQTSTSRIHFVAGFHSGRNAVRSFFRKAREKGLVRKEGEGEGEGGDGGDGKWEEVRFDGERREWGWDVVEAKKQRQQRRGRILEKGNGEDEGEEEEEEEEDEWIEEMESNAERGKWVVVGQLGWSDEALARIDGANA